MYGRSQVRQGDSVHLRQRDLNRRTGGQRFQILKNSLYKIVMFSASIPPKVSEDHAIVVRRQVFDS